MSALLFAVCTAACASERPRAPAADARSDAERAAPAASTVARIERRVAAMGTVLAIEVEAPTRAHALAASEAALRALEESEARLSTWRDDSELSRLNAARAGERVELSPELAAELDQALHWSRATDLAFDPAVGHLVRVWGLRAGGRVPAEDEKRAACLPGGAPRALELAGGTARRLDARLCLEEGGFGKGAGLDAALRALAEAGASSGLLDFGGQLAVFGAGERRCAIADPRDRARVAVEITVDGGSLATSGNSEHAVVVGGVRYGHLIDPRSGDPAPDFGSLTVWAPGALAADCLATGLYVLGPERALAFAEQNDGIEVLVLETTGDGRLRARASSGLEGRVAVLEGSTTLAPATTADASGDARPRTPADTRSPAHHHLE